MIQLKHVNKIYNNGFHAVKDINLEIQKGDILGIIGLSGAGKSSLIRMLNRLEEASSGEIWIEGSPIHSLSKQELLEKRKKIGMIFQHFNLLSSRTVAENVAFSLEIAKWKQSEIQQRVKELLELVELEDKADHYPSQLSGGQKQRVAIARALANQPDILLSDEATSALDPKTTKSILDLLRDIQKKFSLTVVMITHQMEVVREICNKVRTEIRNYQRTDFLRSGKEGTKFQPQKRAYVTQTTFLGKYFRRTCNFYSHSKLCHRYQYHFRKN